MQREVNAPFELRALDQAFFVREYVLDLRQHVLVDDAEVLLGERRLPRRQLRLAIPLRVRNAFSIL